MLTRVGATDGTLTFAGRSVPIRSGEPVAASLLAAGIVSTRSTPASGSPRGPYCMMGACQECLMVVEGVPSTPACRTRVREGMVAGRQQGVRKLADA